MTEIPLDTLRELRRRATQLSETVDSDLRVFLHTKDRLTFRRKPDSKSRDGDVNVTTTCSCVMALALTNEFHRFYFKEDEEGSDDTKAQKLLAFLVKAPWMSSGLTFNNAFTTALVLRTYGLLRDCKLTAAVPPGKRWDLKLKLNKQAEFLGLLKQESDPLAQFLFRSLSDDTRDQLEQFLPGQGEVVVPPKLLDAVTGDLRRITHCSSIYSTDRFPNLSPEYVKSLSLNPYSYDRAELNHQLLAATYNQFIQAPGELSFDKIANQMAEDKEHFRINEYPPAVPVMYWFVDGVSRGDIDLDEKSWRNLCEFACKEFNHQRSLVLADHHAMMDPVAMGMAACLCARLSKIVLNKNKGMSNDALPTMPSSVELVHTVKEVFKHQTSSGIWPKYFPMFHYQEAGSNFCFTFELLEAILHEFAETPDSVAVANELLSDKNILGKLESAVTWCERNRLETLCEADGMTYKGWNSGGELKSLTRRQPESWATAVVHMFLWELKSVLSSHIQRRLLDKYKSTLPKPKTTEDEDFSELLDIELSIKRRAEGLKNILKNELVAKIGKKTEADIRRENLKEPRSALLFGPPGTSKTRLTRALAEALSWPLITINSSDFVKGGLDNVYSQADEIFRDLDDLAGVVVFFDEMDPVMQSREGSDGSKGTVGLDTQTQFLTTSMLPQITKLYDRGRVVFLMATNYKSRFDPALLRSDRFDLLLCMGPPKLPAKIDNLSQFYKRKELDSEQEEKAKAAIRKYAKKDSWIFSQLELLTFAEFKKFLRSCGSGNNIGEKLSGMGQRSFKIAVQEYAKDVTLRMDQLPAELQKLCPEWDKIPSNKLNKLPKTEMVKYLLDRKDSKKQY